MTVSLRHLSVEVQIRAAFPIKYRPLIKRAVQASIEKLPSLVWKQITQNRKTNSVSVSIVSAPQIQKLNSGFRNKDRPTDVLSFPSSPMPGSNFIGDILICWKVAKNQTAEFQTTESEEIQRLVVHGVLHLFGYDHETSPKDERRMFRLQDAILATLRPDRALKPLKKGKR